MYVCRGYVTVKDSDPSSDPIIQPNYLKEDLDMKILRAGCKRAMEILDQPALKDIVGDVRVPSTYPFLLLAFRNQDE